MTRIKYDATLLQYITIFESLTSAKVKDCFPDDEAFTFVIEKGNMGLAIGKGGRNIATVERTLKKKVNVMEFDEDVAEFIRHVVYPLRKFSVSNADGIITLNPEDAKTKGMLYGRDRLHLKRLLSILQRYFDVKEIRIE